MVYRLRTERMGLRAAHELGVGSQWSGVEGAKRVYTRYPPVHDHDTVYNTAHSTACCTLEILSISQHTISVRDYSYCSCCPPIRNPLIPLLCPSHPDHTPLIHITQTQPLTQVKSSKKPLYNHSIRHLYKVSCSVCPCHPPHPVFFPSTPAMQFMQNL